MYSELSTYDQLLLAVEFHLGGLSIPAELQELLGPEIITDITNPVVQKGLSDEQNAPLT